MDSMTGRCSVCWYEFYKSKLYSYDDKLICKSCIPEGLQSCEHCGKVYNQSEMFHYKCKECNLKHAKEIQDFYK